MRFWVRARTGEAPADALKVAEDYTAGANRQRQEKEQQQARKKQRQESQQLSHEPLQVPSHFKW